MPKMHINDISMYYEVYGQGEPLVFIPGFSADHFTWQLVVEQFAENNQVVLLDNRGSGQSDISQDPYQIDQMADDVIALCDKLGIPMAVFIGNSMGGFITQSIAYRYPKRTKKAIICNSAINTKSSFRLFLEAQLELMKADVPLVPLIKASAAWCFSIDFLDQKGNVDKIIELTLSNPYPFTIKGYEAQYAALLNFDSSAWLNQIHIPTLVIGSDQDIILPPSMSEAIARAIPSAAYYCFESCGHLPYIEYPEKFVAVVNQFLME